MAERDDLLNICETLGLNPEKSRNRVNKDTGEKYQESTVKDCRKAIQQYYIDKYRKEGTLSPFVEEIMKMDSPMLALQSKDKRLDKIRDIIWEDNNNWLFQEKIDGCFEYNTPILLDDGSTLPIGYIVENKIKCNVLSYNSITGKIESNKVVNWFNNGYKNNLINFRKNSNKGFLCTDNHRFYNGNDFIEIKDLDNACYISKIKTSIKQMIMGTCLGDTNILNGSNGAILRLCHGYKQREYLYHKCKYLDISNQGSDLSGYNSRTFYANSKSKPEYKYIGNKLNNKLIDESYLNEMGIIGFTYWYLDDGSRSNYKDLDNLSSDIGLATMSFSLDTNVLISNWLTSKGYKNRLSRRFRNNKEQYSITIYRSSADKLFKKMAPYVPECMNYKLPKKYRTIKKIDLNDSDYEYLLVDKFKIKTSTPHKYNSIKDYHIMYDIEVENNHNYFANNFLVHNCRCIVCWDKDYGWDFYSRNPSVVDQLPTSYKTKLVVPDLDKDIMAKYNINNFIIDSELVPLNRDIKDMSNGDTVVADTQLNLVTSILGSLDELSHRIQETNPIKFMTFDLLSINGNFNCNKIDLKTRYVELLKLFPIIREAGLGDRISLVPSTRIGKHDFYDHIIQAGGEGVVAKDLTSVYDLKGKRAGEWIKLKRTVSQSLLMEKTGDTVDAFITGFKPGNIGTANEGLVGALEFSVYLTDDNNEYILDEEGNPVVHHIATLSGITDELRQLASQKDQFGNVCLNPIFYGKVAEIDGQDISSRNYRFAHAVFKGWRPDRSAETCKLMQSVLERLVL